MTAQVTHFGGGVTSSGAAHVIERARCRRLVAEQASCTRVTALATMSSIADATDETLEAVATLVVAGEVRFDAEGKRPGTVTGQLPAALDGSS